MTRNRLLFLAAALWAFPVQALHVVTTTEDLAVLVRTLGGPDVAVRAIAQPNQDPHSIAAKPSFMKQIQESEWVMAIGADLEAGWLPLLLRGARNPEVMPGTEGFSDASDWVRIIEKPTQPMDRSQGDVHPSGNPHYWLAPDNLAALADRVGAELARRLPEQAPAVWERLAAWRSQYDRRLADWERRMAPLRGRPVIIHHSSFNYLLDYFGLEVAGVIEPKPGIPPYPRHLQQLGERMKQRGVKAVLIEPFYDPEPAELLAAQTGARVLVLPISAGGSAETPDGTALMDHLIRALEAALADG